MLDELKKLYLMSFDDSQEYINYFFYNKYAKDNTLLVYDQQKLISMLFLIPKTIRLNSINIPCPYIVGACTHSDYRKMGVMNRLLYDTLIKLYDENKLITALYPFKHSFYEKQGFVSVSYTSKTKIIYQPEHGYLVKNANESNVQDMLEIYNKSMSQIDIFISRDSSAMLNKFKESEITGKTKLIYSNNNLIGYIMYDKEEVIEAIGYGFEAIEELNDRYYETYIVPSNKGVMARIVNPKELLNTINYPKEINITLNIKITDKFFNLNNITLSLNINDGKAKIEKAKDYNYTISIEELSHLIFGSYENSNYNPPSILKEVFPPKRVLLTDKY